MKLSTARFWDEFIEKTKVYGVKDQAFRWYVIQAEKYIKAHQDIRFALHSSENAVNYLSGIGGKQSLQDWQFRQVVYSLRILFVGLYECPYLNTC